MVIDVNEESNKLVFSGMSSGTKYALDMEMFKPIVKADSKWNIKGRNVFLNVAKKDKDEEEWWPRISKDKIKREQIQIDWSRWVDPDDSGDEKKDPMEGMDPSMMQGMGGGGGMPGMGGMGGGMPGMGGMGGMPGMGGMGGMPGMGGPGGPGGGGMDMAAMME